MFAATSLGSTSSPLPSCHFQFVEKRMKIEYDIKINHTPHQPQKRCQYLRNHRTRHRPSTPTPSSTSATPPPMALINAYRRRIKRVNSQPLNEHKTQCRPGPSSNNNNDKSKYKQNSRATTNNNPSSPPSLFSSACHDTP